MLVRTPISSMGSSTSSRMSAHSTILVAIRLHSSSSIHNQRAVPTPSEMASMYPTMYKVASPSSSSNNNYTNISAEGAGPPPKGSSKLPTGGGGASSSGTGAGSGSGGTSDSEGFGASPFEYNTVLRQVFTAPAHKVAIRVETPGGHQTPLTGGTDGKSIPSSQGGVSVATYTYGDLQKDVLDLALRVIRPISAAQHESSNGFDSSAKKPCISPFHPDKLPRGDSSIEIEDIIDDGVDNIAILAHPGYEFVVSLLASWVMNKMAVPMCHTHPYEGEMSYVIENSKARMILTDSILKSTKLPEAYSDPNQRDEAATYDVSVTADVTEALLAMQELRASQNKEDLDATIVDDSASAARRGRPMPTTSEEMFKAARQDRSSKEEEHLNLMKAASLEEFKKQLRPMHEEKALAAKLTKHLEYISTIPGAHDLAKLVNIDKVTSKDADCLMIYTSGTTAKPKGVVHTHRSISNQVEVLHGAWKWTPEDVILNVLPLHHVHGLVNVTLCALTAQAQVIFTPFDNAARIARRLEAGDVTLFMGVPTIYSKLEKVIRNNFTPIEQQSWKDKVSEHIRLMCCGSAALPIPTLEAWREISGHTLLERYGMTEISMALSQPLSPEYMRIPGTVGKPLSSVRAFCAEPATDMGDGNIGELANNNNTEKKVEDGSVVGSLMVNSPSLFNRYWNNPSATQKEVFEHPKTKEVFFNTGDTVKIQPPVSDRPVPLFSILGRTSVDIIKRSGYKISAIEIEAEMLLVKDIVMEVAVLGVAHPSMGEEICAVLVPTMNAITKYSLEKDEDLPEDETPQWVIPDALKDDLSSSLKTRLAAYKCPTHYILLQHPIPRNAMGKINKKALAKTLNLV